MSEPYKFLKNMKLQHYETPTDFFLDFHEQLELLQKETTKLKEQENARLREALEQVFSEDRFNEDYVDISTVIKVREALEGEK